MTDEERRGAMLSEAERKDLEKLLSYAANPEDALNFAELQGFLHGLVITPEAMPRQEWLPVIFGEEMGVSQCEEDAPQFHQLLTQVLDRFHALRLAGNLVFPYTLGHASEEVVNAALDWDYGFCLALEMRPEIWFGERPADDSAKAVSELYTAFAVVRGLAYPGEAEEMFAEELEATEESLGDAELLATLLFALPEAVVRIGQFAAELESRCIENTDGELAGAPVAHDKPCPCGSGRNFKQCCGSRTFH
jgi:uncharacterized protein